MGKAYPEFGKGESGEAEAGLVGSAEMSCQSSETMHKRIPLVFSGRDI